MKKKQQQKIANTAQPGVDRFPVVGRGQREPRDERAGLHRKTGPGPQRRQAQTPGQGKNQQQLLGARHHRGHPRQHPAHQACNQRHRQHHPPDQRPHDAPANGTIGTLGSPQGAHRHHGQHHRQVLHDQKTHRDAPVQRVELPLVGQQLDDDDRARKGQRHRHVQRRHHVFAQRQDQSKPQGDREGQLPQAGGQRHRADVPYVVPVEFEPDDEQQHRHADLGQQRHLVVRLDPPQARRAQRDADHDVSDQHGLTQTHEHRPCSRSHQQQHGEFGEGIDRHIPVPIQRRVDGSPGRARVTRGRRQARSVATTSPTASALVRPGDSKPSRCTRPAQPCCSGPTGAKSGAGSSGPWILGRTPA